MIAEHQIPTAAIQALDTLYVPLSGREGIDQKTVDANPTLGDRA